MNWLVKEEPTNYSFEELVRDGRTTWTGVRNPVAQRHLRSMQKGDRVFFYHTGDQKAVVGIARTAGAPYPDPADESGRLYAIDLVPVRKLKSPVTLKAVKGDPFFADFPLVRVARLSVMPVTDEQWERISGMAEGA